MVLELKDGKKKTYLSSRLSNIPHLLSPVNVFSTRFYKIAVLKNGKIIEVGSHQELVNQNTEYSKLYNLQFTDNNISPVRANISNVR